MGRIGIRQYTLLAILALTAVIVATFVVQKTILTQAAPGINKTINFQGKMTNASGLNVPNGTYQFVFRLYNVASGGSAAWTETVNLPVTDGIFHHNLGSVSALPGSVDFDTDNIFLGITFNSDPAGEMSPRVQLTASPYAFNSDQLDGLDASDFLQLDPSTAQLGSIAITGNIAAGGTATASRFISTVASGTAPLTVTSTTMVANLNADLLDGQHGAYYRNASNINAGTLSDARLSANVSLLGQTIGLSELEANSVDSSKVVNNSLTADDLAANSVDSSEIVDGSVDESHLNITNAPTAGNVLQFGGSNNFTWVNPATLPTSGVSSLNTLTGSLTLQGNAQVGVSSAGSVISLSIQNDSIGDAQLAFNTGQHLTVTSSPTFAGLTVNGDITMAGSNTLDLNSGRIAFAKSGLNKFSNLAAFDTSGNVTGAIVIKTNIPRNSRMNWVRFKGYNYTSNPILDLTIAGYWYNSGYSWNNRGFVNNGGRTPSNVQFGVDSSDNVVIIIGSTTDTWSYPHFLVDEWVIGTGNASNADASNWQIAVEDDLSTYSNTVAVANDSFTPYDSQYVNVTGDTMSGALTVSNTVTATLFSGSGASLTNLNASNLATGTVPNARISGSYTGFTNVTGTGNADFARFLGNGADTAASPSFTWSNDTNTGVFRGGADILGFSTAGTESMRILANGNVGIGTTSPTAKLMLSGSGANNDGILRIQSTSGGGDGALVKLGEFNYLNQDNSGAGYFSWGASFDGDTNQFVRQYTSNPAYLGFVKLGTTNGDVSIGSSTSNLQADTNPTMSTSLTVKGGTGYVGIGTASPSTALHVNGTATATLFSGSGASLTNLNGSNISTGTIANARLTGSGALTVTAGNGLTGGGSVALGSSTSLTIGAGSCITVGATNVGVTDNCVNAATVGGVASGSLVQLQPTTPGTAQTGNINISGTAIAGSFSGNGASLTNLNASNLASGTVANARLTGSGALTVTAGSGLTGGGSVALGGSTTINVGADAITDTHLAFNTGQHLTVTSTPTFSSLNLGSSGVLRFGGTAGYAYTSKPRYTVDNTTLLSDFDNYSRSLSFIENTASGHGYYGTYDTLKLYTNNAGIQYFYQYNGVTADTPIRYRTADYSGSGWNDWRSIASQEWANTNLVRIQGSTPGTAQSGHLNITGTAIAGSFSGNGSLLTNLNASNITSGTLAVARGGTGATTAAGARTNLGATTVGANFFTLTNPSAVTFARINADNTVSALSAADFRAAIGAGTGGGSVTSINVSGGTTGLTTSGGPITSSGTITLGGTLGVANGGTGASTAQAAINNISGLTTAGDLLYHNGSNSTRLARGTNGQCLTSNASTILWGSCGGGISGSGSNGQVSFWTGAGSQGGSSNFFWNNSTSSLGLGTASPSARLHVDGGSILATGTHGGGNGITVTGAGTRMFFDVNKSAFRAGYVDGNQWNNANVGNWSIALGYNTTASGGISTALGWDAIASGDTSIAIGAGAAASGDTSIAIGAGVTASSWASTALGQGTTASGSRSTAFGAQTTASGSDSTTFGTATTASGTSSTAFGFATTAQAYASTVLGRYNVIQGSTTSWVGTDQLFVVGNGSDASNRSNALTILKNGNVGIGIASPSVALDVSGTVAATLFSGSGASLTNLNASSITSGTLAVARGGTGATTAQAAINALSGLTTAGDLLYHNGSNSTRLARGSNGQCLTSNASTILWGACGGGGITTVGTFSTTNTAAGGATISGSQIIFQAASTTAPGMVSISNQSFVGDKTFTGSTTLGDASNDTLTINGTNVLIPNNLNIDSNTLFIDSTNDSVGIGTTSLTDKRLSVQYDVSGNNSSTAVYGKLSVANDPASGSPLHYAGHFVAELQSTIAYGGELAGVVGSATVNTTGNEFINKVTGVKGTVQLSGMSDVGFGMVSGINSHVSVASNANISWAAGLHVQSATVTSGYIGENYGVYIANQTGGSNDYGLYIQGADTYALWVGSGTSRLDGTLEVNGPSSSTSNAPLALSVQGGNATGSYSCITPTYGLSGQCGYNGGGSSIIGGSGTSGLAGPNPSNAAAGGNGGEILIEGGAGGNVSGLYSISGSGGDIIIQGGAAGTGGTLSGSNGNVLLARDRGSVGIGTASPTELLHVAGNIRFTGRVQGDDGTVSLPAYTFQMDTNTGLYRPGPDILGVTTGGTEVARFTSGQLQMNNGTAAAPAFSFSSDGDVGLYRAGANILGVSTAGTVLARFTSNQFQVVNGTAATPAITFTSDTNTGIFRSQADALAISSGGSFMFEVNTLGANVQGIFAVATLGGGQSTHVCWGGYGILSTCSSSARYKKDIATANWGLDQIRQLRPVTYNWKEDGRAGFGFIAEEVAQISPYFAFHHNGQIEGVNYSELTSVLAAGIQQLDVIVHNEKTRLDGVVSVNQMQQATLSNLMAGMNGLEMGISQVQDQLSAGAFSSLNITGPASIQNLQVVNNLAVGNNLTVVNRIITQHITISGHVRTAGDTPTFELGTTLDVLGAVIELSGLTIEVSGNDTSGTIRLITADDPVGLEEGHLAQINFANKFDYRPRVMLSSANATTTRAGLFVDNEQVTRDYFRLFSIDELEPNSTYELNYWIVE